MGDVSDARGMSKTILGRPDAYKAQIIEAMARALFVVTWGNWEEEHGRSHGGEDLMRAAPRTPSQARTAARVLAKKFARSNGKATMSDLYADAINKSGKHERSTSPDSFGHDMAMEALGTGVAWSDDHPDFKHHTPSFEFSKTGSNHYYYPRE